MNIILNNTLTSLPDEVRTLEDLIKWKNIPTSATAIAINGKIANLSKASIIHLQPEDSVMVITAAFGG